MESSENELIARVGQGALAIAAASISRPFDRGVILVRKLWNDAIETSLRGEDPPNSMRDRAPNRSVHVNVVERWVNAEELREHVPNIVHISWASIYRAIQARCADGSGSRRKAWDVSPESMALWFRNGTSVDERGRWRSLRPEFEER